MWKTQNNTQPSNKILMLIKTHKTIKNVIILTDRWTTSKTISTFLTTNAQGFFFFFFQNHI